MKPLYGIAGLALAAMIALPSFAQETGEDEAEAAEAAPVKVSPRVAEICTTRHDSFFAIERCLGRVHVAINVLEAIEAEYGEAGAELVARCREANEAGPDAVKGCAVDAVETALRLEARLPEGTEVADPLFGPLTEEDARAAIAAAEQEARAAFPERQVWSDPIYTPLN